MFCEYAAHVTFPGIKLTTNDKGVVFVGSFNDKKKLLNTTVELIRRLGYSVMSVVALLPNRETDAVQSQLDLMEMFADVFKLPIKNNEQYKKARELIKTLLSYR